MLKSFRGRYFTALLKIQSPSSCCRNPNIPVLFFSNSFAFSPSSLFQWRQFSLSPQISGNSEEKAPKKALKNVQPLSAFFGEAVGLSENSENNAVNFGGDSANLKLMERLRKLEGGVRSLNKGKHLNPSSKRGNSSEEIGTRQRLSELFADEKKNKVKLVDSIDFGNKDGMVHKELSPDMQLFAHHLYLKGYLDGANFIRKNKFDLTVLGDSYGRGFLKHAAVKFGEDHPEIAKWLSASDLKKLALFGCPSPSKRVYAAKYLRGFFQIEEHEVCQKCALKNSCKHANSKPHKDSSKLNLATVIRVLVLYALEEVPPQLVVPEEIRDSVARLLKEIINLSQNGS